MNTEKVKLGPVLSQVFTSLLYPQIALLIFLPFLVSLLCVGLGLWLTWDFWLAYFYNGASTLQPYWNHLLESSPSFLQSLLSFLSFIAPYILFFLLFALSYPVVIALNLMIVSFLASTYLVKFIARRDYKDLELNGHNRFAAGLWNTISSTLLFLFFWLVTIPLWLIPGVAFILPLLLTAWLNRRVCTFDALTDYATDFELTEQKDLTARPGFLLGLITAGFNYIPLAFLISPVLTMVGFIHLGLHSLSLQRLSQKKTS